MFVIISNNEIVISNACKYIAFFKLFICPFFLFQKGSYFLFNLFNFASEIVQAISKGCDKNYPLTGKKCKKNYLMK